MVLLQKPEECVVSEKGKAQACMPCQKACNWPSGLAEVTMVTGSRIITKLTHSAVQTALVDSLPNSLSITLYILQ